MGKAEGREQLKDTGYEIFVGALSVLSILNMLLMWLVDDASMDYVLQTMNVLLSGILFLDFCYRLYSAPSRRDYVLRDYGWADLLASVPLSQAKILRAFRLARVYRLMRALGVRHVLTTVVRNRAGSALLSLLLIAILVLEFGSLAMLRLESRSPEANITSASDALWYLIVTMSTVGYGDQFPVTNPGRVLGSAVIVIGVGIFGTLTGFLANAFLAAPAEPPAEPEAHASATASPGANPEAERIRQLEELRDQHRAALATIESLLDERR